MKIKKYILILLLLSILFVCVKCKKEDYNDVTYCSTIGIGYVFMYDSIGNLLYPIQGAEIKITSCLDYADGFLSPKSPSELFLSNEIGKFQVCFIKRTQLRDAVKYLIEIKYCDEKFGSVSWHKFLNALTPDDIINVPNNTIEFDTVKFVIKCER